ncbi:hypothetical protein GCM10009122_06690 [Fulvivirga kasyanovii]|uniref:MFS transporter n=1 Tax=Fulvivirga kasyanovii TaxID=396812 RepID=A0ABW9RKS0_9BACT|nr:hypothetical protein [Fulvivirga kasyanovii]MTI23505.1 hypothetical protein [Fulvivirga kasyanovii]
MSFKSPENFHNKLGFVFHAMLALPLAAFVYLFLELRHRELQPALDDNAVIFILTYLLPVLGASAVIGGYFKFKKDLKGVNQQESLRDKLEAYYAASLKLYGFIELGSLIFVGGLYLTTSAAFILFYVLLLFFMSLNRPTPQKYVNDLRLTEKEREVILYKGSFEEAESTSPEKN